MGTLEEFLDSLQQEDVENVLDELVYDLKSQEATDINNGGRESQLQYLREAGETDEDLKQMILDQFPFEIDGA